MDLFLPARSVAVRSHTPRIKPTWGNMNNKKHKASNMFNLAGVRQLVSKARWTCSKIQQERKDNCKMNTIPLGLYEQMLSKQRIQMIHEYNRIVSYLGPHEGKVGLVLM